MREETKRRNKAKRKREERAKEKREWRRQKTQCFFVICHVEAKR